MFEALIDGLSLVLQWKAFSLMLLGMGLGFCVGLLPGIGGAATLALMIPFVFKMSPAEAFAFLLGMHSVAATTGDITSILFGVPGEGLSAATVVDGYPMAKNGEAGRALGAALMSSLVGALIGAVALALAIPVVRPLVLTFGSPELFFLSMIGIACITSLSGLGLRGQIRGFAMGLFGLLLSTIGQERQSGSLRFDMGLMYLWEGLDLVPVLVGIFAIPELVDLAVRGTSIAGDRPAENLGPWGHGRHQRYLSPFLAGGSLFRGGSFRRCHARSGRRCGAVDGLRSRSAERERFQGSGTLRQRRCARRARAGSGEQLEGRRRSSADHRLRRAGKRSYGNPSRRIYDHGAGARARYVEQTFSGDLLDGLDISDRQYHHRRALARWFSTNSPR